MTFLRWALGVPLFALPDLDYSWHFALEVAVAVSLAGLSATAAVYLAAEWVLRPAFALALAPEAPPDARSLGIGPRLLLTWLLCSGVPIVMLALIPVARDVARPEGARRADAVRRRDGARAPGFVGHQARHAGGHPPDPPHAPGGRRRRRRRLEAAWRSTTAARSAGCRPASTGWSSGLRERERLRDLYGRQVGPDVARAALEDGWELGGGAARSSALFVDVIGSTTLAERESPERVVALLNEFFAAVVGGRRRSTAAS